MLKYTRIFHWITTGLLTLLLSMSAAMYLFNYEEVCAVFLGLGFPIWLIYPMAIAHISAVIVLLSKFNTALVEWAYAGVFFNLIIAVGAHASLHDDQMFPAMVGLALNVVSYLTWKKMAHSEEIKP